VGHIFNTANFSTDRHYPEQTREVGVVAAIERCFCSSKEEKVNRTNSRTAMTSAAAAFVLFLNALAVIPSSRDLVEVHVCSNHTTIRIRTPITECMHSRDAVCYVQLFGTNHLSRNSCNIKCATGSSLSARRFEHPSAANTNSFVNCLAMEIDSEKKVQLKNPTMLLCL
jgi:hypothetical protein